MSRRANLILALVLVGVGLVGMAATVGVGALGGSNERATDSQRPGPRANQDQQRRGMERGTERDRERDSDALFIERMIPHHEDAIEMAELAATRSKRPQIRQLAEDIQRTQSQEIEQMRGWYDDWYGTEVPDVGDEPSGMMGGRIDMQRLEAADDFDREFIPMMVMHHRMGVMMSRMAGRTTDREEMRELTDSIIETQSREIEQMLGWYDEWYGR